MRTFKAFNITKTRNAKIVMVYGPTPRAAALALMDKAKANGVRVKAVCIWEGDREDGCFSMELFGTRDRKWSVQVDAIGTLPECEASQLVDA